jgi:hypothetical protein
MLNNEDNSNNLKEHLLSKNGKEKEKEIEINKFARKLSTITSNNNYNRKNSINKITTEELNKKLISLKNEKPPIQKNSINKLFSLKVILHFLLALFTILQILQIINPINEKMRAQERIFYDIFLEKTNKDDVSFERIIYLKDIKAIKKHFLKSLESYFNINSLLINQVKRPFENIELEFFYLNSNENIFNNLKNKSLSLSLPLQFDFSNNSISNEELNMLKFSNLTITKDNFGPFMLSDIQLKEFLKDVKFFRIHLPLIIFNYDDIKEKEICTDWVKINVLTNRIQILFINYFLFYYIIYN